MIDGEEPTLPIPAPFPADLDDVAREAVREEPVPEVQREPGTDQRKERQRRRLPTERFSSGLFEFGLGWPQGVGPDRLDLGDGAALGADRDGEPTQVPVRILATDGTRTAVTSPKLSEGAEVLVGVQTARN